MGPKGGHRERRQERHWRRGEWGRRQGAGGRRVAYSGWWSAVAGRTAREASECCGVAGRATWSGGGGAGRGSGGAGGGRGRWKATRQGGPGQSMWAGGGGDGGIALGTVGAIAGAWGRLSGRAGAEAEGQGQESLGQWRGQRGAGACPGCWCLAADDVGRWRPACTPCWQQSRGSHAAGGGPAAGHEPRGRVGQGWGGSGAGQETARWWARWRRRSGRGAMLHGWGVTGVVCEVAAMG